MWLKTNFWLKFFCDQNFLATVVIVTAVIVTGVEVTVVIVTVVIVTIVMKTVVRVISDGSDDSNSDTKLKNSIWDKTQKLKVRPNTKILNVTKFKNSNCDRTKK